MPANLQPMKRKRGRPGWWPSTLQDMQCGETIKATSKSEAMTIYSAARRLGNMRISIKKEGDHYLCEKICQ